MKCYLVFWLLLAYSSTVCAQFSGVTVFGDSLSDVGNLNSATLGLQPGRDYFEGRFSNGPVYSELLASKLEVGPLEATTDGGSNYAYGGARTSGTSFFEGGLFIRDLDDQIDDFLEDSQVQESELYIVFAGSNDFILGNATDPAVRAQRVVSQIDRLLDADVKNLLSINLPLLGETPEGRADRSALNARATEFNATLSAGLDALDMADVNLFRFDLSEMFSFLLSESEVFGFTNTTDTGISAADPSGYLFWDDNHPTTQAHELIAEAAYRQVQSIAAFGGDFDFDGELSSIDVDLLSRQVAMETGRLSFDLDQDGELGTADVDELLNSAGRINGDADFDLEVGFSDFLELSRNYGRDDSGVTWSLGDFDSNGEVGFPDFLIVSGNFMKSPNLANVPEPSGFCFVLTGAAMLWVAKRR